MYRLLLPPDANAGRHAAAEYGQLRRFWLSLLQPARDLLHALGVGRH